MTNPQRFITRVVLFLIVTAIVVGILFEVVWRAFMHNPGLNGLIVAVLILGILYSFRRILVLKPETEWIEAFRTNQPGFSLQEPPRLLAPLAVVLGERERRGRASLSALSMRYLLDSISYRLDESRDISRYLTGLLIFLGLLGTFWGLLETINSVANVIADLSLTRGELSAIFDEMKAGLAAPLNGMGTAFSSSLFGLSGSLILGFLDLQATQAQNSFYNDMEEWLSGLTRLSAFDNDADGASAGGGGGPAMPAYMSAMLQQTSENLEHLRHTVQRSEENRQQLTQIVGDLGGHLHVLNERLGEQQHLTERLLKAEEATLQVLQNNAGNEMQLDETSKQYLRSLDVRLAQIGDSLDRNQGEMIRELGQEIKLVAKTIAIAAGEPNQPPAPSQAAANPAQDPPDGNARDGVTFRPSDPSNRPRT